MSIAIIGAGHAGVEAAQAAAQAGAHVTLFSAERVLPYFRPRLTAYAFGQADAAALHMHPAEWYPAHGIDLLLNTRVAALDPLTGTVLAAGQSRRFDAVVVATGARPIALPSAGAPHPAVLPLWDWDHAEAIRARVRKGGRLVVIGGGILGIEAALRALELGMHVRIIERMERLMPAQFGTRASDVLRHRLSVRGIDVRTGRSVAALTPDGNDRVAVGLDDGSVFDADVCLTSVGARPDAALPAQALLAVERGLVVGPDLQTSSTACFAAGDVVQHQGLTRCSAREAAAQGRIAGANAAAPHSGRAVQTYQPETLPLMFRNGDFEIYAIGEPGGEGYEEHLLPTAAERTIRALIKRDGIPVGVQMIGTREEFDHCAALVKQARRGAT